MLRISFVFYTLLLILVAVLGFLHLKILPLKVSEETKGAVLHSYSENSKSYKCICLHFGKENLITLNIDEITAKVAFK